MNWSSCEGDAFNFLIFLCCPHGFSFKYSTCFASSGDLSFNATLPHFFISAIVN